MTEASAPRPMPARIATVISEIMLPASGPTMVAPKMTSVPLRTCTLTKPATAAHHFVWHASRLQTNTQRNRHMHAASRKHEATCEMEARSRACPSAVQDCAVDFGEVPGEGVKADGICLAAAAVHSRVRWARCEPASHPTIDQQFSVSDVWASCEWHHPLDWAHWLVSRQRHTSRSAGYMPTCATSGSV